MRILVVENEHYLAQSITSKLSDVGYICESAKTKEEAMHHKDIDVVVLSTNISEQNFQPVIDKFKKAIIILMVSYINNDTVGEPLKKGADDYLVKPIMIEELIRKIKHYREFNRLKKECLSVRSYLEHSLEEKIVEKPTSDIKLPIFLKTNQQESADYFALKLAEIKDLEFQFFDLDKEDYRKAIEKSERKDLTYLINFQNLKKSDKVALFENIGNKNIVISSTDSLEESQIYSIDLKADIKNFSSSDFLTIEDYVKQVIENYQSRYPDTQLSEKLGISRKSLWEKRKKYGIFKNKG